MGPEVSILLSILGLFVFSCICFTCCYNCFGTRRRRTAATSDTSNRCFHCCIMTDNGHDCLWCFPASQTQATVSGDTIDTGASNVHHGCCTGCFGDDCNCCDCEGGDSGDAGLCSGGDDVSCCDCGGASGGGGGGNDAGACCDGGDAGNAGDCDCGGGDCDGCDC